MELAKTIEKINEDREKIEACFTFCLWKDPELFENYLSINENGDKTIKNPDAQFYFNLGKAMYKQGYRTFDHVSLETFLGNKPEARKKYEEFGGWREIENLKSIVSIDNVETYFDQIAKMNGLEAIAKKYDEVFTDVSRFKNCSSEDVFNTFDLLNTSVSINTGHHAVIEDLVITDEFLAECDAGEEMGLSYSKGAPLLNYSTLGAPLGDMYLFAGHSGCVDAKTEFFNGKKWKPISEYEKGDMVLQWDTDGTAELVYPLRYIKEPCNMMYHFETKYGLDQTLSPEHRIPYYDKTHGKHKFSEITMEEMYNKHITTKNGFEGGFITTFNYDGNGIDLTDEEIELMLATIADGSFYSKCNENNKCWKTCRFHIKKDRKKTELRDLFERGNFKYREVKSAAEGYTDFYVEAPRREKEFEDYWYNCSHKQLLLVCNNVLKWDGAISITKNGETRRSFSTTIRKNADFIQFAFSACGYKATIKTYDRIGKIKTTGNKEYERKSIEYSVNITDRSELKFNTHYKNKTQIIKVVPSDNMKYCFTVPSSYLVLRRNDKIFITGNCGKSSFIFENMVIPFSQQGIGCAIISNEMRSKAYKFLLLAHILTQDLNYWTLTRKKLKLGSYSEEDWEMLRKAQAISKEKYSNIKFVKLFDNNTAEVIKFIKRFKSQGIKAVVWDTMKNDDSMDDTLWQQLLMNSRKIFNVVSKEEISMIVTFQLALHTTNQRYLDAGCLSNSKQVKEVVSEMVLMRRLWDDEYTGEKYDCHPYKFNRDNKKIKEMLTLEKDRIYAVCFLDKTRNDQDKITILYEWQAHFNRWIEIGYCNIVNEHRSY